MQMFLISYRRAIKHMLCYLVLLNPEVFVCHVFGLTCYVL